MPPLRTSVLLPVAQSLRGSSNDLRTLIVTGQRPFAAQEVIFKLARSIGLPVEGVRAEHAATPGSR